MLEYHYHVWPCNMARGDYYAIWPCGRARVIKTRVIKVSAQGSGCIEIKIELSGLD